MSPIQLRYLSGTAGVFGGSLLIFATGVLLVLVRSMGQSAATMTSGAWVWVGCLQVAAYALVLLALVGLYLAQAESLGRAGLVAFLMAFAGQSLDLGLAFLSATGLPVIVGSMPELADAGILAFPPPVREGIIAAVALWVVGYLAFGVVTLRGGVLPRRAAWVLIAGSLLFFFPVVFGAAIVWLGRSVRARAGDSNAARFV